MQNIYCLIAYNLLQFLKFCLGLRIFIYTSKSNKYLFNKQLFWYLKSNKQIYLSNVFFGRLCNAAYFPHSWTALSIIKHDNKDGNQQIFKERKNKQCFFVLDNYLILVPLELCWDLTYFFLSQPKVPAMYLPNFIGES